jgi:G:T-mismatch repair DNA endonuclease (very short patch repair protein)
MRRVHSTNTTLEILLRKALWQRGLRYAICEAERRGKVALEDQFGLARSKDYWLEKIRKNMGRDVL